MLRGDLCPHKCLPSQLDSVGFNRHFNELPEDSQGNLAVRELFISYHQSQIHLVSIQIIYLQILSSMSKGV